MTRTTEVTYHCDPCGNSVTGNTPEARDWRDIKVIRTVLSAVASFSSSYHLCPACMHALNVVLGVPSKEPK